MLDPGTEAVNQATTRQTQEQTGTPCDVGQAESPAKSYLTGFRSTRRSSPRIQATC